ncbi:hypothetical protein CCP4SC76_6200003 [Gammaproteobacteria bacterium]
MELAEKHGKSVDHAGSPMTRKIGNAPGIVCVDNFKARGNKKSEEKNKTARNRYLLFSRA